MSAGYAARLKDYPDKGVCGLPERYDTSRELILKIKQLAEWIKEAHDNFQKYQKYQQQQQQSSEKGKGKLAKENKKGRNKRKRRRGSSSSSSSSSSCDDEYNTSSFAKTQKTGIIVVLTGAGISTSAGIPDFRGPNGVWTAELKKNNKNGIGKNGKSTTKDTAAIAKTQQQRRQPNVTMDFSKAKPTLTHRAITTLTVQKKYIHFCMTQNVDGLHRRSGLPRSKQAVLHGCAFTETCEVCGAEYFRDFDVGGMSFQLTGRLCTQNKNCTGGGTGALRDTLLDWEDPLPEEDFELSTKLCKRAELVICLGTSLRIEPAASLPEKARRYVIVNLQETPKDDDADLIIRAKVDDVMVALMELLGFPNWDNHTEITTDHDTDDTDDTDCTAVSVFSPQLLPAIDRVWIPTGGKRTIESVLQGCTTATRANTTTNTSGTGGSCSLTKKKTKKKDD